ncbi:MAG: hypothetical protein DDT42_01875 [candidate division WS2 bacterium]|uniref:Uncharacterized protein n=1 Tax=Psychracetigena formicireducens TaxID=2986056 RepID=A0A9E2BI29_PSYF1|nr:hypothetical protein [Candidatus Psychracetigena formicireducens]
MLRFVFDINTSGSRLIEIPQCQYDYVNIANNSQFDIQLFKGNSVNQLDLIGFVPPFTVLSLPHDKLVSVVNVVWTGATSTINHRVTLYYSINNLGWGGNLNAPVAVTPAVTPVSFTTPIAISPAVTPVSFTTPVPVTPPPPPPFEGIRPGINPVVFNLALPAVNTEYIVNLGLTTNFTCYLEENNLAFRISYVAGRVATSIRPFLLIPSGARYGETGINHLIILHVAVGTAPRNFTVIRWQ